MGNVAIVTDSTICLPDKLRERYSIHIVSIHLLFGDHDYLDGIDLLPSQFYAMLREAKQPPTTAPATPGEYLKAFRKAADAGSSGILCVTVSRRLSAMYACAMQAQATAREELPGFPIQVLDSTVAAAAEGFVVLEAARAAATGAPLSEVTQVGASMIGRVNLIATLDTLDYLVRGGRVPRATGWIGNFLAIKPIVHFRDGAVELLERGRGRRHALERLVELLEERVGGASPVHVAIQPAEAPEEAALMRGWIASRFNCAELFVTDFTPVMGAHAGPGTIALSFWAESPTRN